MTVEAFEVGARVKISGISKGKGFQGTIKRHNFASGPKSHGSHNVRAPGSIGASATPSRVFKGIRGPGQMGNKRVTQKGLEVVAIEAERNLLLVRGSVPGPARLDRGGAQRCLTLPCSAPTAPPRRSSSTTPPSARASPSRSCTRACAPSRPRAAAGRPRPRRAAMVSGGGAKPWRQKGTGRARAGSSRSPIWTGGGTVFGPKPRSYTFKVNRKEQRAALRSALSLHAQRGSIAILDAAAFTAPKTRQALDLLDDWDTSAGKRPRRSSCSHPSESDAALSFRNLARVAVLTPENVGVTDLLGAAQLLVSQQALDALTARTAKPRGGEEAEA